MCAPSRSPVSASAEVDGTHQHELSHPKTKQLGKAAASSSSRTAHPCLSRGAAGARASGFGSHELDEDAEWGLAQLHRGDPKEHCLLFPPVARALLLDFFTADGMMPP